MARVRAALRRRRWQHGTEIEEPYTLVDLTIDYAERQVTLAGQPLQLTAMEYNLLRSLSVKPGARGDPRPVIQDRYGGPGKGGDLRALRTLLRRLRRKLEGETGGHTAAT